MKRIRQEGALKRLKQQLITGKVGPKMDRDMTDKDRKRINEWIKNLEAKGVTAK